MTTLVDRLRSVNDRLQVLPARLGVPQYAQVVLKLEDTYTVLTPQPLMLEIDPRRVGQFLANNVEIGADDLVLKGVSRAYSDDLLIEATYLLNATQDGAGKWTGTKAECLNLDRSRLLDYTVLVRRFRHR